MYIIPNIHQRKNMRGNGTGGPRYPNKNQIPGNDCDHTIKSTSNISSLKTKTSYNFHTQTAAFAFSTSFLHILIHFTRSELVANTHWSRQVAALALGSTGLLMRVGPGNCLISNNAFVDGCLKKNKQFGSSFL